jgi:hypothetical protein
MRFDHNFHHKIYRDKIAINVYEAGALLSGGSGNAVRKLVKANVLLTMEIHDEIKLYV